MPKPVYVLGTNLSHDCSACLLKDGKICAAIEKERITRRKHDGGSDNDVILYCLAKEGITLDEVDLIVQNSTYDDYNGPRLFTKRSHVPVVTISHHLAHAFSAYGTSSFDECAVLVIDGSGNRLNSCTDLNGGKSILNKDIPVDQYSKYKEINSYYHFVGNQYTTIAKEVSVLNSEWNNWFTPHTAASLGDLYAVVSGYCFRDYMDAGKLMGLAPYGNPLAYREEFIQLKDGITEIDYSALSQLTRPAGSHAEFKANFQYYADIANWVQREVERTILSIINSRYKMFPSDDLAYAGGVALNAVANGKILASSPFKRLYIQPAAGDNGISIGCAFYGWLQVLQKGKVAPDRTTCYGKIYDTRAIKDAAHQYHAQDPVVIKKEIDSFFSNIGKRCKDIPSANYRYLLQFNVEDAGTYQVKVSKEGVRSGCDIIGRPTSLVRLKNTDFYDGLADPAYFAALLVEGKMESTNFHELNHLVETIGYSSWPNMQDMKKSASHAAYVHFEGEGYIEETARLLSEGKVIGWFQDECEFGPRALGRRSILADPRKKGVRDYINLEIKCREDYRPFAPSVLAEDLQVYFETEVEAPYMLTVGQIKNEWREQIRDVVHVDGSCRIQTVTADWNPKYTALIKEFKKLTGISILLNTSFNGRSMPIVETPLDALKFFYDCKLDYLVMQDIIIKQSVR
jgi:predicted NodU family carbamoyl transferase